MAKAVSITNGKYNFIYFILFMLVATIHIVNNNVVWADREYEQFSVYNTITFALNNWVCNLLVFEVGQKVSAERL